MRWSRLRESRRRWRCRGRVPWGIGGRLLGSTDGRWVESTMSRDTSARPAASGDPGNRGPLAGPRVQHPANRGSGRDGHGRSDRPGRRRPRPVPTARATFRPRRSGSRRPAPRRPPDRTRPAPAAPGRCPEGPTEGRAIPPWGRAREWLPGPSDLQATRSARGGCPQDGSGRLESSSKEKRRTPTRAIARTRREMIGNPRVRDHFRRPLRGNARKNENGEHFWGIREAFAGALCCGETPVFQGFSGK